MRILILFTFFVGLFYYFNPKVPKPENMDAVKVKVSAPKRKGPPVASVKRAPAIIHEGHLAETPSEEIPEEVEYDESYEIAQEPSTDFDEGWKAELRDFLIREHHEGEMMFEKYLSENEHYGSEIDRISKGYTSNRELEEALRKLDENHDTTLRDIFGNLYSEVEALHSQYYDSVQQGNQTGEDGPVRMRL